MKTKSILAFVAISGILLTIYLYPNDFSHTSSIKSTKQIRLKEIEAGNKSRVSAETRNHKEMLQSIDEAWESIRAGNAYDDDGQFDQAIESYERAYALGEKAVGGLKLAMSYEKIGRYADGITLLDQMIKNGELSANGVKNANVIKSRLLAAKARSSQ